MGSIMSAIRDDIAEYEALCDKYVEAVQRRPDAYGNMLPDCYGDHAAGLKFRAHVEYAMRHGKTREQAEVGAAHLLPSSKREWAEGKGWVAKPKTAWDHILKD